MPYLDAQQGRALAIILSTMSLLVHFGVFAVLRTALGENWTSSWCAWYDLSAIFASLAGVIGAVDRRPLLFSAYATIHSTTLILLTSILLLNAVPLSLVSALPPLAQHWRFSEDLERSMCREDGFGWDDSWLDQCRSGFAVLSTGALWVAFAMVAAQWWAMVEVWAWVGGVKEGRTRGRAGSVGKGRVRFADEVEGLESIKEV